MEIKKAVNILSVNLVTFLMFLSLAGAENLDQVIAIVNDDIITASELGRLVGPIYFQYKNTYQGEELDRQMNKVQADALKQLIENKLLIQEAQKTKEIVVLEKEVMENIEEVKTRFASEEEFQQALEQDKMTMDELKKSIKEQLLISKILSFKVYSKILVAPREVEDYYTGASSEFIEKEKVNICHILIKKGDDNEAARQNISKVLALLNKGEDFASLAKQYSEGPKAAEGGEVGFFERGHMLKEIEDAAFVLDVGKYSGIIETNIGYHLVYLKAKKKGKKTELKDAWNTVENTLYQQKTGKKYEEYIASLKKDAYITIVR